MKYVYATWELHEFPPAVENIHISRGSGDEQYDGFDMDSLEAKLTVEATMFPDGKCGYIVTYSAWSDGIENEPFGWLSPCLLDDKHEAKEFGIKEGRP